ncbi:hypothetical protein [Pontibaca methylaminivorans]|uniref:O-Antigen ligase n=1 Tax=Pontibaca methylaminivorans TaxID=515897 RepID=A0A1R3X0H6_9RHOB|nr:hypothetical protein [Pontibaca methylaminivorans]SIT84105.1 hypothetical protein SAMN05421849_2044 [Pontibaca methylaminivorans]
MPNILAYLMLALWPLICLWMFRRMPIERALIWSVLGGYLVLPPDTYFHLPALPVDKFAMASIVPFMICVFVMKRRIPLLPESAPLRVLSVVFVFSIIPTIMNNGEPVFLVHNPFGAALPPLPGLGYKDLVSLMIGQAVTLLPFLMAREILASPAGLRELLVALVVAGVAYSLPALVEIRFSPQINVWVYGFFQHSFEQMMRSGGFRPIVFLPHGLWAALFFFTALLSAAALTRDMPELRQRYRMLTGYLGVILVLCKSYAALGYGLLLTPFALLGSPKLQLRIAIVLATLAFTYPAARAAQLVPLDGIVAQVAQLNVDRSRSLDFRFINEELLMERAREKALFGWGSWGRGLIYDSETGENESVTDSRWIIVFGNYGWVGYVAETGLLALPLLLLGWHRRRHPEAMSPYAAPVAIIVAATLVDMTVNATLVPFTWLCAGAVLGHAERIAARTANEPVPDGPPPDAENPAGAAEPATRRRAKRRRTVL